MDFCTSLLRTFVNYGRKMFCNTGPRTRWPENPDFGDRSFKPGKYRAWSCGDLRVSILQNFFFIINAPEKCARVLLKLKMLAGAKHSSLFLPKRLWLRKKMFLTLNAGCGKTRYGPGKTNWRERLSTVDLLIKIACFGTKVNCIFNTKMSCSKLVSTIRSTVLSLPLQ